MGMTIASPLALFKDMEGNFLTLKSLGIFFENQNAYPTWGIISVAGIIACLAFVSIFMFKNRKRQMSLCALNIILILFFYITLFTYSYFGLKSMALTFESVAYGITMPFIALVCNILALGKIKADEKLVKSLERIR